MSDPQTSALSASSYTNCAEYCHDVFISHRGPDVKNTFASYLYYRLRLHGLQPFLDREELQAGELLSPQIEGAIRTASVHITIFSPGYADSRWCLDELLFILKKSGDAIIPVFYNVKPSELRWTGRYLEALANHEQNGRYDRQTLENWRKALSDVSYRVGFELQAYNGDEGKLLEEVVQCVVKRGRKIGLNVARYPTGLEENVEDFEITVSLQHRQKGKVKVLGSVSMVELSKTTRARKVFTGESSNFVHGQVEEGTPISKYPEKVTFQKETLLAVTENFNVDKGCDFVKFEGGVENIKPSAGSKLYFWMKRFIQRGNIKREHLETTERCSELDDAHAVIFKMKTLLRATQNFHPSTKIGEGGFGSVYKGTTQDGREIAVKKLSRMSRQGNTEFLTEVKLLTKIQNENLVNLLGYCTEGSELMLVYDYLPNQSLDRILFDPNKRQKLSWQMRYNIIMGIAYGLVYLHDDCRPQIIHRDIKPGNILLDQEMNPKIADFGLAKVFDDNVSHVSTRAAGTLAYMAPEYAIQGRLSIKADVYSFGVLLLELIAGRKVLESSSEKLFLLEWAWGSYREGNIVQIIDPSIIETCDKQQVLRCIHVAFLCIQSNSSLRPRMSTTTLMLSSPSEKLPDPTEPPFFGQNETNANSTSATLASTSSVYTRQPITTSTKPAFIGQNETNVNSTSATQNEKQSFSGYEDCYVSGR